MDENHLKHFHPDSVWEKKNERASQRDLSPSSLNSTCLEANVFV